MQYGIFAHKHLTTPSSAFFFATPTEFSNQKTNSTPPFSRVHGHVSPRVSISPNDAKKNKNKSSSGQVCHEKKKLYPTLYLWSTPHPGCQSQIEGYSYRASRSKKCNNPGGDWKSVHCFIHPRWLAGFLPSAVGYMGRLYIYGYIYRT